MKIKMLRNLANRPDRLEGQTYDVKPKEATDLIAAGLAVDPSKPDVTPAAAGDDDDEGEGERKPASPPPPPPQPPATTKK